MKVTEEGTTNIIKWYQPESSEECKSIDCRKCVYYSYVPSSSSCPFEAWMINHPAKKPTDPSRSEKAREHLAKHWGIFPSLKTLEQQLNEAQVKVTTEQNTDTAQDILNMCATLQANTMQMQVDPLQDMVNVLDLVIEVTEKQDKLTKIQQEQPAQEDQSNIPLWFMPSMENANDDVDGRDHYHHCPQKDNKLVRLIYVKEDKVHACPTCRRVFYLK